MACSALFSAASRAASSSSRCLIRRSASSSTSGSRACSASRRSVGFLPVELGLAGDQLRLALVDVREPRKRVARRRVTLLRLALELLDARAQLRRAGRELQLALVELPCACGETLVAAVRAGELRLALRQHLLSGFELRPSLRQLALRGCELLFAGTQGFPAESESLLPVRESPREQRRDRMSRAPSAPCVRPTRSPSS